MTVGLSAAPGDVPPARRGAGIDRVAVALEPVANRAVYVGVLVMLLAAIPGSPLPLLAGLVVVGFGIVLLAVGFALRAAGRPRVRPQEEAVPLAFPLRGRWEALNGPAERVPSHRTHTHGQSRAIDFVHVPEGYERPGLGWALLAPAAAAYPAFGQPVLSPVAGTVVRTRDGQRDGRGRMSWPALAFMVSVEAVARTLPGSDRLFGNHVVLDAGGGRWVVLAHLRRGSVAVREGERIEAGHVVGACGNSGNSAEPHLHMSVMDHPRALLGVGLPWRFVDAVGDDGEPVGVPRDEHGVREAPGAAPAVGVPPG